MKSNNKKEYLTHNINLKESNMKKQMMMAVMVVATAMSSSAYADGCLKGAAVGGVAGHFVGKHPILGAVGGCVVGRHMANKKDKQAKAAQAQAQEQARRNNTYQTNNQNQYPKQVNTR